MDTQASFGGFIPLWILGAPLVLFLIGSFMEPKSSTRQRSDAQPGYPAPAARPDYGSLAR
jgi:hypothetical protein